MMGFLGSPEDPRRSERGAATVEAVLVVPLVLVPLLLGVVVFGRLEHTRLVIDAAAAAGARAAAAEGRDSPNVRARISIELRDGGLDPARAAVSVVPAVAGWGEPIRVRVAVHEAASIPFIGAWSIPLDAEFVSRGEVTH
jgi:hypothetical protein